MKKVATLYRVSTKGQLDDNDIPMQQRACLNFIDSRDDWELVKEYIERGVSGFKVSEKDRDVLQQVKKDAEKGVFNVLLVFMFDRLGRREDETPYVLEWFVKNGTEMWSVLEGQQKIEEHIDKLCNYLRFWQSSGESRKTSERVNEKHTQMVEDGIFRGGGIPYGYKGVESGAVNKKGKPLLKLVVDPVESEIVKKIYDLVHEEGYGQHRIAKYLNEQGIPAKKAKNWGAATINVILKNPIYKGIMRYRTEKKVTMSPPNSDLIIIKPEVWDSVQNVREQKNPKNFTPLNNSSVPLSTKGKALLVGMARCGVCNSRMTTTVFVNKYKDSEGNVRKYNSAPSYRCTGKKEGKTNCNGQSTFSSSKIDKLVLLHIYKYLDELKQKDFTSIIQSTKNDNLNTESNELKILQRKIGEKYEELSTLSSEVPKALMGKSSFNAELLSKLIDEKNVEIDKLKTEIQNKENTLQSKKLIKKEVEDFKKNIAVWREVFENATTEKKKMMLSSLISEVYITKDLVDIVFKIHIKEIIESLSVKEDKVLSQLS